MGVVYTLLGRGGKMVEIIKERRGEK